MFTSNTTTATSFPDKLKAFKQTLKEVFYEKDNIEKFILKRGFPALVLRDIMASNPLSVAIPTTYGGRGAITKECIGMMGAASYESLPLSLTFGINIALFLEPVAKYGTEEAKSEIFQRFLTQQNMGGLMITEPDFGSDALSMQTYNMPNGDNFHIKGTKHWQGLTGLADYWLITSRAKNENGDLGRDIDFFVSDNQKSEQRIHVEEYYNNIGLYPIPYGKNILDIQVPKQYKLIPETTGIKLMMDLLHRSRFQFTGMGIGFIHRLLDEAIKHTTSRFVGGKALISYDQVKHQVSKIQSAFTISSAMSARSAAYSGIENNLANDAVEANSIKAYITDLMQDSAQILTQLYGANGYKMESLGARGIVDSRPFQIFEGSNDMLYTQISEVVIKAMTRAKNNNLISFLKGYAPTLNSADLFKSQLDFTIDKNLPQRKLVDLGKVISRVVSSGYLMNIEEKGFRKDLINEAIQHIKLEVNTLVSSFSYNIKSNPIEDYHDDSSWLSFC